MAFRINPNELTDGFFMEGTDLAELKEVIEVTNSCTQFLKMKSGDINLLSMVGPAVRDIRDKDGKLVAGDANVIETIYLSPMNLPTDAPDNTINSHMKVFRAPETMHPLMDEWVNRTKLGIMYNERNGSQTFYYTSGSALQTMDRFGLSGEFLLTPSLVRNLAVADSFKKDLGVTAIVRSTSDGKAKKIFTILSEKYTHINQLVLFDIIKQIEDAGEMGECKCFKWEVSNFFTKLYVEFPKKAEELSGLYGLSREMIPGIMITTSDTGDASFAVKGTWRAKGSNSLIVNSEVKRKHIGDIDIRKIIDDISKEIFAEYAKLPEALCELMAKDVTDPAWDLKTSAGIKANQTEIENTLKTVFKRLGIVKAIGKKTEKILRQAMMDEIDPSIRYTAYDMCMLIMSLPERVVFMDKGKDITLLQKACGQAPFADYSVDATVVLTA